MSTHRIPRHLTFVVIVLFLAGGSILWADRSAAISSDQAKQIVLKDAGVNERDASFRLIDIVKKGPKSVYNIQFSAFGTLYTYAVDTRRGKILEKNTENIAGNASGNQVAQNRSQPSNPVSSSSSGGRLANTAAAGSKAAPAPSRASGGSDSNPGSVSSGHSYGAETRQISMDDAKSIAAGDLKISVNAVRFEKIELTQEQNKDVYRLQLIAKNRRYRYVIDAGTGEILKAER